AANETPLLIAVQTVTNGMGGVSWNTGSTAHVYLQAVEPGTATLVYSFYGTGEAEGIVSRASMKLTAVSINIDGDYYRNGIPADHPLEADAVFFTNDVGMVILPNKNDDTDDGIPNVDCADNVINGHTDLADIYALRISRLGISYDAIPDGLTIELSIKNPEGEPLGMPAAQNRVRIFRSLDQNAQGVVGPVPLTDKVLFRKNPGPNDMDMSLLVGFGYYNVGIEGISHGTEVVVQLTAKVNGQELASDAIRLLISPFLVLSNTDKATKIFVANASGWEDFYNEMVFALDGIIPVVEYGSDFTQDYAEIGATMSAPNQLERKRCTIAGFFGDRYADQVAQDTGFFHIQAGNPGGNIEASPPISGFPYGRLIVGSGLQANIKQLLEAQKIQTDNGRMIELPVGWLRVKHIDEVMAIIPVGSDFKVLVADFQQAIDLLRNNPEEEIWEPYNEFDGTRSQILSAYDNNPEKVTEINTELAAVRHILAQELGIDDSNFIKVPVAFKIVGGGSYDTVLPNMVNMVVIKPLSGNPVLVVPHPGFVPFATALSN
ncbi:MAG: hypothetical protein GX804_07195, partial [Lentisphaerae bacterium]|nr:hypothetical protein [Lentisphaerota bacterium]